MHAVTLEGLTAYGMRILRDSNAGNPERVGSPPSRFALRRAPWVTRPTDALPKVAETDEFAVGMRIAAHPPHRSERAQLRHSAPTLGV